MKKNKIIRLLPLPFEIDVNIKVPTNLISNDTKLKTLEEKNIISNYESIYS